MVIGLPGRPRHADLARSVDRGMGRELPGFHRSRLVAAYTPPRGQTRLRQATSPWLVGRLPFGAWTRASGLVDATGPHAGDGLFAEVLLDDLFERHRLDLGLLVVVRDSEPRQRRLLRSARLHPRRARRGLRVNAFTLNCARLQPSDILSRLEAHGYHHTELEAGTYKGAYCGNILATPAPT